MENTETKKHMSLWTRKELEALPGREWNEDIGEFDSFIILPMRKIHDSGYRIMSIVAVKSGIPFCRLTACSDVIHLDGTGGYGKFKGLPSLITPRWWRIDCLRKSGLLHIFTETKLTAGDALSDFDIFAEEPGKLKI
jgi:hypothetical protein